MPVAGVTIFGILNVTRDSFSDGGRYLDPDAAIAHAVDLVRDGADVIDIGAASSHPEADEVAPDEEIRRLEPVLAALHAREIAISIDSWQTPVQQFAISAGATWINDIRGFPEASFYPLLSASTARLVVMHSIAGGSRATRDEADPEAVWRGLLEFFDARIDALFHGGIPRERLVIDPGMGLFLGSNPEPSVLVLQRLPELRERYGLPILVSASRKSFVGRLAGRPRILDRGAASLATELFAIEKGATLIRTHEPGPLRDALAVRESLRDA